LGFLPALPQSRSAASQSLHFLSRLLVLNRGWQAFRNLVRRRPLERSSSGSGSECSPPPASSDGALQVAVAYDEAFQHYFVDALDALEAGGAVLRTFSPLRDESLPEGADLVVLGSGRLEQYASRLALNHCLLESLRRYIAEGGRVYAEAGGLAYLSESLELGEGRRWPMVGALPLTARHRGSSLAAEPVELVTSATCWLARRGTPLRGYRDDQWDFQRRGPLYEIAGHGPDHLAIAGRHNIVGSRLHLHFAALPGLLENLLACPTRVLAPAEH
jgi:cobyrinic acid a,c-diamide synthase